MAKLERPEAIARLEEILNASDAVMVARGDLGLELPLERVPRVQKEITRCGARARGAGHRGDAGARVDAHRAPRPTRAEVSDAANAVEDGVDAIMLAGETAAGEYPVKAVQTLDVVIREAESMPPVRRQVDREQRLSCPGTRTPCARRRSRWPSGRRGGDRGGHARRQDGPGRCRRCARARRSTRRRDDASVSRRLALCLGRRAGADRSRGEVNAAASRIGSELVARGAIEAGAVIVVVSITDDLSRGPSNFFKLQRV